MSEDVAHTPDSGIDSGLVCGFPKNTSFDCDAGSGFDSQSLSMQTRPASFRCADRGRRRFGVRAAAGCSIRRTRLRSSGGGGLWPQFR